VIFVNDIKQLDAFWLHGNVSLPLSDGDE